MAQLTILYGAVSTGCLVWDLLVLLVIGYTAQALWSWRRLSHVPGPFFNSLSSLPLLRVNLSGHSHSNLSDLTSKYGTISLGFQSLFDKGSSGGAWVCDGMHRPG